MKVSKNSSIVVIALSITGCMVLGTALAGQESDSAVLEEIVVTATKSPQAPGNVTQKIAVIDQSELENLVVEKNLADILMYEPGIAVSVLSRNDANWGANGGLSQKYNTYMLDGLPIDAFVEPQSLPIDALERVEVQRGPASVLYPNYMSMDFAGNQSPLAGTTNFILKDDFSENLSAVDVHYGSYNTYGGSFYHQQAGDHVSFLFGGSYEESDYTDYGTEDSWLNMIDDPGYQKAKIFLKSTAFFNEKKDHRASIFVSHTDHEGDAGRPNRDFDHQYWTLNTDYSLPIGDAFTTTLKVGYRGYDRTWEDDNYPTSLDLASESGVEQHIIPADLSVAYRHLEGGILTVGSDYQNVSYETYSETTEKVLGNDADAYQYGLYAQEEMTLGDFVLRAGGRYSYTEHEIDLLGGSSPGNNEQDWDKLLWSAGVKYNVNQAVSLYTNAGSSFVAPSLKSVGGTISLADRGVAGKNGQLPNPDLEPETGVGYDFGVDVTPIDGLKFGARTFYTLVDDQIVTVVVNDDPSQSQDINADQTTSYGVELSVEQRLSNWLKWFANYTYTSAEIESDMDPDQDGAEVPFVPEHMGNIGANIRLPYDITASVYLHLTSSIYDSTSKTGRSEFDGYEVLNASLTKDFMIESGYTLTAYLDFYNLTDNEYEMPWQFQDPGFSMMGGVKVQF